MTQPASRSRRDRPAKAPLSRDAVIDAALGVLKADGMKAVTMRRVATELDTGPASLYVYVSNHDELLREMFDRVAGTIPLEAPDPERWRDQLVRMLTSMKEVLEAHPGIARVAFAEIPVGPNALRVSDTAIGLFRAGGVDDRSAAWAMDVVSLYVSATALETSVHQAAGHDEAFIEEELARVQAAFASVTAEEAPNIVALQSALLSGTGDERFAWGLEVLISGLLATPPPEPADG